MGGAFPTPLLAHQFQAEDDQSSGNPGFGVSEGGGDSLSTHPGLRRKQGQGFRTQKAGRCMLARSVLEREGG